MKLSSLKQKLKLLLIGTALMSLGCVTQNPYNSSDPVDLALKICGLGYSSDAATLYRGAYQITNKQASAEFETKFGQNLETQMSNMFKNIKPADEGSMKVVSDQIKETRECVLEQINSYREPSRSDLVSQCIADLKRRVGATDNGYPYIREWTVIENDNRNSKNNLVVGYVFSQGGPDLSRAIICKIKNNKYDDLTPVELK